MDCALRAYSLELIDKEIDDLVIDFFNVMITQFWIKRYYTQLSPYLEIYSKGVQVTQKKKENTSTSNEEDRNQKTKFIINMVTLTFIRKVLQKYIEHYKLKWGDVDSHMKKIRSIFLYYLKKEMGIN